ncbi:MAG: DUF6340 family protein [Breznakibacter sp.]
MKKIRIVPYLFLVMLMVACSTPYQVRQIDVLRPAAYTLPSNVKNIVLVDNTLPYRNKGVHSVEMAGRKIAIDSFYNDRMPAILMQALQRELQNRGYFANVFIDTVSQKQPWIHRSKSLSQAQIDEVGLRFGADAVLSLDDYSYATISQVTQPEFNWYFALLSANMKSLWRFAALGNPNQGTFEVQKDTLFWSGEGLTPDLSVMEFPDYGTILSSLADFAGYNFSNQITPYWEPVSRVFFADGNEYFVNATAWTQNDNWEEAIKIWGYIYQNGKPLEKARAATNLSYAQEMKGQIDEAAIWCAKGLAIYDTLHAKNIDKEKAQVGVFFKELLKRQQDIARLKKQMGQ